MSANPAVLKRDDTERRKRAIALWDERVQTLTEAATGGAGPTTSRSHGETQKQKKSG